MPKDDRGIITTTGLLYKQGGSTVLVMPKEWIDRHNLKAGDEVGIVANSILKVIPVTEIE